MTANGPNSSANRDDAIAIVRRLRDAGHVAYFAGGCVRDTLLGLEPKDYDVATDAPPDRVRQLFPNTQAVGAAFGVILVRQRKSMIEVATFRTDLKYTDGRRPEGVVFTTAEEDAKRRDFTINGLFMDPLDGDRIIDYVGGQEDLKNRILRAIGEPNHRFEEDHLRLLRAVRFAARFGLKIDPKTDKAMTTHGDQLKRISPERIGDELRMMLTPTTRDDAFDLLWRFLPVIMRFLPDRPGYRPELGSLFHALGPPLVRTPISFGLALAGMTIEYRMKMGPQSAEELIQPAKIRESCAALRQSLKISNEESDNMEGAMSFGHLIQQTPPTIASMKRFLAEPYSSDARLLMAALARISDPPQREPIEQVLDRLGALARTEFAPPPLLTGDDLTVAGLRPSPVFKRVFDAVYDAQLEDRISSKEQALELALRLAQNS